MINNILLSIRRYLLHYSPLIIESHILQLRFFFFFFFFVCVYPMDSNLSIKKGTLRKIYIPDLKSLVLSRSYE